MNRPSKRSPHIQRLLLNKPRRGFLIATLPTAPPSHLYYFARLCIPCPLRTNSRSRRHRIASRWKSGGLAFSQLASSSLGCAEPEVPR
ncbi:hypothetical protein ACP70R_029935 [Stipagrostis hirtigluma subsp. patula]